MEDGGNAAPPPLPFDRSIPHQGRTNTSSLLESSSSNRHRKSRSQQVGGGNLLTFFIAPFPFAELHGLNLLLLSILGVKAEVTQVKFLRGSKTGAPCYAGTVPIQEENNRPDKGTHSLCSRSLAMMCWFWSAAFTSFATWVLALSRFSVTQETLFFMSF